MAFVKGEGMTVKTVLAPLFEDKRCIDANPEAPSGLGGLLQGHSNKVGLAKEGREREKETLRAQPFFFL